jgi:hypothetical protein
MMRHQTQDPRLSRRLAAEQRGDEAGAERAFAELFAALPPPGLPSGFADAVLARVAAEGALAGALGRRAIWPLEQVALGLLAICAAALGLLPHWLPQLWDRLAPESWVGTITDLLVGVARGLAALAPLWESLVRVARWTLLAAGSPQVLAAVALCCLLAATAGRLLVVLLDERSSGHAQVG